MSTAITADDVDARLYEAQAATSRTNSSVKKNVTIFTITADLWRVNRLLKELVNLFKTADFANIAGMTCQYAEKRLAELIPRLDDVLLLCARKGFNNRTLTAGALRSIELRTEELKDIWVMFNSSTDSDLEEMLSTAKSEETVAWESVWRS